MNNQPTNPRTGRPRRPRGARAGGHPGGGEPPATADLAGWLAGRLPDAWFEESPELSVDREEIIVVGPLGAPEVDSGDIDGRASESARTAAESGRIQRFREDTREQRIEIAQEIERRYARKVAWGAICGNTRELFSTLSVPVMTRLRQEQRQVLDTLVDAGVARSRSEALAWCVELVNQNQGEWIEQLRDALVTVEQARSAGPDLSG